jgi:dynein assembly factor 5
LFVAVASWLGYNAGGIAESSPTAVVLLQLSRSTAASLLPLLLVGVSDPQPSLATLTLQLVEGVGRAWSGGSDAGAKSGAEGVVETSMASSPQAMEGVEQSGAGQAEGDEASAERAAEAAVSACQYGPPYSGRPAAGARRMVNDLLPLLLSPLLQEVGEWTVGQRACAARQLQTVLVLAERGVEPLLPRLLPALCSAIGDEDVEVAGRIIAAVHVVGAHVEPRRWLPLMFDNVSR